MAALPFCGIPARWTYRHGTAVPPPPVDLLPQGKAWNAGAAGALIDEDPRAYKDVRKVMADQSDLTEIVHTLTQVLNYKGTTG